MNVTFQSLVDDFIKGDTAGHSGSPSNPGNLRIIQNQLIHYSTPIAERYGDKFIINVTRYSLQTGRLQKMIKSSIPANMIIEAKRVPADKTLSLVDYI